MNPRLKSGCMLASALAHAVLLAVLIVTPAFKSTRRQPLEAPPLLLLPGSFFEAPPGPPASAPEPRREPEAQPEPAQAPQPARQPEPQPEPEAPQPRTQSAPEPRRVQETPRPKPDPEPARTPPRRREFNLSEAKPVNRPKPSETPREPDRSAERLRELDRRLANAAGSLADSARRSTVKIELSGGGGAGSSNAWNVRAAYDAAWIAPSGVADPNATAEVEVVLRADGTVASARIARRSGVAALDRSVELAIGKVRRVTPWEPLGPGETITFTIGFNLRSSASF